MIEEGMLELVAVLKGDRSIGDEDQIVAEIKVPLFVHQGSRAFQYGVEVALKSFLGIAADGPVQFYRVEKRPAVMGSSGGNAETVDISVWVDL